MAIAIGAYIAIEFLQMREVEALLEFAAKPRLATLLGGGPLQVIGGQPWRLITPIFLHAPPSPGLGILHILFNMWWLKDLGAIIERSHSSLTLLVLAVVSALGSNVAQYLHQGPNFRGMSGVVYALFGFMWIRSRVDRSVPYRMPKDLVIWMLGWFAICLVGLVPNMANTAHGAGLAIGMLAGAMGARRESPRSSKAARPPKET